MIELKNLYKSFNSRDVFRDLSFDIHKGESLVIIGRSGCGKSVLLKHIIGLIKPDKGNIIINGVDITKIKDKELNDIRKKFGMLFQGSALFDSLTVFENVGFQLFEHTNNDIKQAAKRVGECLDMVGLRGVEQMKPAELSGGMQKRVGIARAICMSPEIILFDEPTTGLDPIMGDTINNLIRSIHRELKITFITVTHDMKSAYKIADRICMFHGHKLMEVGTPEDASNSDNPIVKQFVYGRAQGPLT